MAPAAPSLVPVPLVHIPYFSDTGRIFPLAFPDPPFVRTERDEAIAPRQQESKQPENPWESCIDIVAEKVIHKYQ